MASRTFRLALTLTPLQAGGMVLHIHAVFDIERVEAVNVVLTEGSSLDGKGIAR